MAVAVAVLAFATLALVLAAIGVAVGAAARLARATWRRRDVRRRLAERDAYRGRREAERANKEEANIAALVDRFFPFAKAAWIAGKGHADPRARLRDALGKIDEMRTSLASTLRSMFLLALPASIGLILLARPIVSMLYQRGEFNDIVAEMTAWALIWFAAGLIGHSVMEVLTRAFYAQHDTKTPVIIGTIAMGLNVIFSFAFARLFSQLGWMPHGGLALANSLATALEATCLFIFMRERLNGIEGTYVARGFAACAAASLGMGIGLWLWIQATGNFPAWAISLGGVAIGGLLYLLGILLLKVPELKVITRAVSARLSR